MVEDQDAARDFYVDVLGFELSDDIAMGEGFRWLTVGHPSRPELMLTRRPTSRGEHVRGTRARLDA